MAINLNQLKALLDHANTAAATEKEVRKSLVRVENLIGHITKELTGIYELLDGATPAVKQRRTPTSKEELLTDPEAPYGRRKDGTPKGKPSRSKSNEAGA